MEGNPGLRGPVCAGEMEKEIISRRLCMRGKWRASSCMWMRTANPKLEKPILGRGHIFCAFLTVGWGPIEHRRAKKCKHLFCRGSRGEVKKQVGGCGFDPLIECALTTTRKGETTTAAHNTYISAASGRANVPRGNNWYRNNVDSSPGSSVARATRVTITAM